jgi:hypothetical protein
VADVIYDLAGFQRAHQGLVAESVSRHAAPVAICDLTVVLIAAARCPRPALTRTALVHLGQVPGQRVGVFEGKRATPNASTPELVMVALTKTPGMRVTVTFAALLLDSRMARLKRVAVSAKPLVVGYAEFLAIRRAVTVKAV